MWWEPASDPEYEVATWLVGAEQRFSAGDHHLGQVWGVGAYITPEGLRPLVLLDETVVGEVPSPVPRLLSFRLLPDEAQMNISYWEFPERTVFLVVSRPEPLSRLESIAVSPGSVLRCTNTGKQGTIGPAVEGHDPYGARFTGVLTAGHVMPNGEFSPVDVVQPRRFRPPRYSHVGSVMYHSDPMGQGGPGYDVAVVKLDTNTHITGFAVSGVAKVQAPLTQPMLCNMYGGVSGTFAQAGIVGALSSYGDPRERLWKNSWLMLPSSVAQQGDSGSLVSVNSTSEGVGLLVGGSRAVNTSWYLSWYAQDLSSIESDFLSPLGATIC